MKAVNVVDDAIVQEVIIVGSGGARRTSSDALDKAGRVIEMVARQKANSA